MRDGPAAPPVPRTVLLTLGSNIDPEIRLFEALDELDRILELASVSSIYEADPVGAPGTPVFLNAAARLTSDRDPRALKREVCRPLEARLGRIRGPDPNAPRTIDIDIAAVSAGPPKPEGGELEVLDPDIAVNAHLALPLGDVAPACIHPDERATLGEIAARFVDAPGIRRRADLRWPRP
ncbi:MAG: 2-amino-4-hydroxy-6-hydroxymethyldihydropteridine diphosphokinase [Gemmatimonadota bacterium]|nr:2-amino-4-hydroxy-6-hydroxymethyldihydropteridine diphosphokinase [Gemmatimonadota bacterium]